MPSENTLRTGVIGAGQMGLGIVQSLTHNGFAVDACDIDPTRETLAAALGATLQPTAAALAAACDCIIVVVVDAGQIEEVLSGEGGMLSILGPGKLVLLCSTIAPSDAARFAAAIEARGALALDVPISGGPAKAAAGTMTAIVAGSDAALRQVEPVLAAISGRRFVISSRHGDAARTKLVNNLLAGVNLAAGAEAMALARRLGLDPQRMLAVISASSGQSWMIDDRMPRALSGDLEPRAAMHVLTKDLSLVDGAATSEGVELVIGRAALDVFRDACANDFRDADDGALLRYFEQRFER
jgi:L-threonate 2-dehydrogenase